MGQEMYEQPIRVKPSVLMSLWRQIKHHQRRSNKTHGDSDDIDTHVYIFELYTYNGAKGVQ